MKNQVDDFKAATDHMTAEKVQYNNAASFFIQLITLQLPHNYLFF
jgi:hypothetical protein